MRSLRFYVLSSIFFSQCLILSVTARAETVPDRATIYSLQYVQTAVPSDYASIDSEAASDVLPAVSSIINANLQFAEVDTNYENNKVFLSGIMHYEIVSGPFGDGLDAKLSVKSAEAKFTLISSGKGKGFECELIPVDQKEVLYNPVLVRGLQSLAVAMADAHGVELYSGEVSRRAIDVDSQHVEMAAPAAGSKIGWVARHGNLCSYYHKVSRELIRSDVRYEYNSIMTVRKIN